MCQQLNMWPRRVSTLPSALGVQAVAYGMGGGLLQRVNRDTMQFATKLCHIVYADGSQRDIAKMPKSDAAKTVRSAFVSCGVVIATCFCRLLAAHACSTHSCCALSLLPTTQ